MKIIMRRHCLVGKERERERHAQKENSVQTVQADLFILIFASIQFSEISVIY